MTLLAITSGFVVGAFLWGFAEYALHRFAMHDLKGKGLMSREHLEHHVHASWHFSSMHLLSWAGMLLVGFVAWLPLGWAVVGSAFGLSVAVGWSVGYFFYEGNHAAAHLRAPSGRYSRWLRKHHFHHHFGHPQANHGVSWPFWDVVFATVERPTQVRIPRRLAPVWLTDADGSVKPELQADYVLVGHATADERVEALDRARAFASVAPAD